MELIINNLYKSYGQKEVLKDVCLQVKSGSAFGLLGRNGAGKTTTIRIIMDVITSNGGEVLLDGKKIDRNNVKIGYLPEERGLYPKKKIKDQLIYFAMLKGLKKKDAEKSVLYWLDYLGMAEYTNKKLEILSKGNQQKIQLITAVAHDPDIVILDEPFSGLDPVNAELLKNVVRDQIAKQKIVILSSHQMSNVEEFCEDIAMINYGKIVLTGNLSDIKRSYPRNKLMVKSLDVEKIQENENLHFEKLDNGLLISLEDEIQKQTVMQNLIAKYDIDEVKVFEPSLNDIFIEYAQDDAEKNVEGAKNEAV